MVTLGQIFKEARRKKKLSIESLAYKTKIKQSFLRALENHSWELLPEYPVVVGFVKNTASVLGVDERKAVALLRRDYPPQILPINPKPDVENKFLWSPRLTFFAGLLLIFLALSGYLVLQYSRFVSPPPLEITIPQEGQIIKETSLRVIGRTNPEVAVRVNNQPVIVEQTGEFIANLEIFEGTTEIIVVARSRSGKETTVKRMIKPELK